MGTGIDHRHRFARRIVRNVIHVAIRSTDRFDVDPQCRELPVAKDRVDRDDEDLVRLYLTDIGQYTLLTKDDEVRLAKAIEAGNEALAELDAAGKELTAGQEA